MAWDAINTVPAMHGKSLALRELFAKVANAALAKGQTEQEATFAGTIAVKIEEKKNQPAKAQPPKVPAHLAAVRSFTEPYNMVSKAVEPASVPTVQAAEFDAQGHLVILMSDGSKIATKGKAVEEHITQNVGMSINPMFDYVRMNTTADQPAHEEGLIFWDTEDHSLAYYNDETNVKVNIGREELVRVYNNTNTPFIDGQVVYVSAANTGWPIITLAKADASVTSQSVIGLVTAPIEPHTYGYVCVGGIVHDLNTSSYAAGATLYLSPTIAGGFTNIRPAQPNYEVEIGTVLYPHTTAGKIYVHIDKKDWFPSLELIEDSTLALPTTPTVFKPTHTTYNDGFIYDNTTGEITVLNNGSYTIAMTFNAQPSASNKYIYYYAEESDNTIWTINRFSAKKLELINQTETQVTLTVSKYFPKGHKMRFRIWGDATVTLRTSDLPGTVAGTVTIPSYRLLVA